MFGTAVVDCAADCEPEAELGCTVDGVGVVVGVACVAVGLEEEAEACVVLILVKDFEVV